MPPLAIPAQAGIQRIKRALRAPSGRSEGAADSHKLAPPPAGAIARMCAFRAVFALESRPCSSQGQALRGNSGIRGPRPKICAGMADKREPLFFPSIGFWAYASWRRRLRSVAGSYADSPVPPPRASRRSSQKLESFSCMEFCRRRAFRCSKSTRSRAWSWL